MCAIYRKPSIFFYLFVLPFRWYYQDMECIRDYLKNMTHIDCQTHHITNADISGFDPPPVIKDHCKCKLNIFNCSF